MSLLSKTFLRKESSLKYSEKSRKVKIFRNDVRRSSSRSFKTLKMEGIQSTFGISWFKDDDTVINHIFPDVPDRKVGIDIDWRNCVKNKTNRKNEGTVYTERKAHEYKRPAKLERQYDKQNEWFEKIRAQ